ncbi:MAG: hypothetical protein J0I07_45210 [Myxococcales bacterium]|nr:hypothetical protein [Myxococcales bacterium]
MKSRVGGSILTAGIACVALIAGERTASAQLIPAGLYDDAKEIITDLIREDIARGAADYLRGAAPALGAYFAGSLKRFETAQWGALRDTAKRETRIFATDFTYWVLTNCAPSNRATECLRRFVTCGSEGATCQLEDGWLVADDEVTAKLDTSTPRNEDRKPHRALRLASPLVDTRCRGEVPQKTVTSVVACDTARAVDAALSGKRQDVEGRAGMLVADLLAAAGIIDTAFAAPIGEWLASPEGFQAAHRKLFELLHEDPAKLARQDPCGAQQTPSRFCALTRWSRSATAIKLDWQNTPRNVSYADLVRSGMLDKIRAGSLREADDALLTGALRIVGNPPGVPASGTLRISLENTHADVVLNNGSYGPQALDPLMPKLDEIADVANAARELERLYPQRDVALAAQSISTTIRIIHSLERHRIIARSDGQLRIDPARLTEAVTVIDDVVHDQQKKLCPKLEWLCTAGKHAREVEFLTQVLSVALRGNTRDLVTELAPTALIRQQYDIAIDNDFNTIKKELGSSLDLDEKRRGEIAAAPANDRKAKLVKIVATSKNVSESEATARVESAIANISQNKQQAADVRARFLVAFSLYLLDDDEGANSGSVSKQAFRAAAKDLILSEGRSGYPAREPGLLNFDFGALPNLSLRASFSSGYSVPNDSSSTSRYTLSIEPLVLRWRPMRNAGMQLSFIDVFAPLSEAILRNRAYSRTGEWRILADVLRPRIGVWAGIPELSRHVLVTAGLGFRILDATRRSTAEADKYEYGFVWDSAANKLDAFEAQTAVSWVF